MPGHVKIAPRDALYLAAAGALAYGLWWLWRKIPTKAQVQHAAEATGDAVFSAIGLPTADEAGPVLEATVSSWDRTYTASQAAKRLGLSTQDEIRMNTTQEGRDLLIKLAKEGRRYVPSLDTRPWYDFTSWPPITAFVLADSDPGSGQRW